MDERVSIRRFRSEAVGDCPAETVVRLMRELGPEGGDFVVLRATPDRAEAIERNLVAQLFTMGAHVAGEPVGDEPRCLCDHPGSPPIAVDCPRHGGDL